jgi:hypothetical protein
MGALFLRSTKNPPTLLSQHERLQCTGTTHKNRMTDIRGLAWEAYMSCVSSFSCRMYINSNLRDSQI